MSIEHGRFGKAARSLVEQDQQTTALLDPGTFRERSYRHCTETIATVIQPVVDQARLELKQNGVHLEQIKYFCREEGSLLVDLYLCRPQEEHHYHAMRTAEYSIGYEALGLDFVARRSKTTSILRDLRSLIGFRQGKPLTKEIVARFIELAIAEWRDIVFGA